MTEDCRPYRRNVAALISNGKGRLLACERADRPGAWQVPQGGVDDGEDEETALRRELAEELGRRDLHLVAVSRCLYRYDFPTDLNAPIATRFRGQEQRYFAVRLGDERLPSPVDTDGEFRAFRWMTPFQLSAGMVEFKRPAFLAALEELKEFL